ncbi:MAG: rod shape-determining protein [Magnetococcales bacterium]|nr:rod shape-determining protein [Magnetococcales bacterium]
MQTSSQGKEILVGIDLGTSRTAIISNRGTKKMIRTVVGYPKDIIGVKILGQTRVIGEEALEKHSYLNLFYPLENGVLKETSEKDNQATMELLQHVMTLVGAGPTDKVSGIVGVPARASISSRSQLLKFTDSVMDFSMVVSEPFMVAYGLNRLNRSIIIDIGAGTIDLCAMKGMIPGSDDQITLLKGGNYIDDIFMKAVAESYPEVQFTPLLAQKIKDAHGFVGDAPEAVVVNLRTGGRPVPHDLTEELRMSCESIVPDIVESLEHIITLFDPEEQEEVLQNIILAGGGSRIRGLDSMIADALQGFGTVKISRVSDPDYAGAAGALKMASELPTDYWNQIGDVMGEEG